MLVKEGHKGSYILGGIIQIVLCIVCMAFFLPEILSSFGVEVAAWNEFLQKIYTSAVGKYVYALFFFIIVILFVFDIFAIFFRRSGSSFFFKIAGLLVMFPFALYAFVSGIFWAFGSDVSNVLTILHKSVLYILLVASFVCAVLGFVFHFTVSKNNKNKASTFVMAKSFIWFALFVLNFIVPDQTIMTSAAIYALFAGPNPIHLPLFLAWFFLIMGIWQLASSPELINPNDSSFTSGTPQRPQMQNIPQQPYNPYGPYPGAGAPPFYYPPNYGPYGPAQGLENGEQTQQGQPVQNEQNQNLEAPAQVQEETPRQYESKQELNETQTAYEPTEAYQSQTQEFPKFEELNEQETPFIQDQTELVFNEGSDNNSESQAEENYEATPTYTEPEQSYEPEEQTENIEEIQESENQPEEQSEEQNVEQIETEEQIEPEDGVQTEPIVPAPVIEEKPKTVRKTVSRKTSTSAKKPAAKKATPAKKVDKTEAKQDVSLFDLEKEIKAFASEQKESKPKVTRKPKLSPEEQKQKDLENAISNLDQAISKKGKKE